MPVTTVTVETDGELYERFTFDPASQLWTDSAGSADLANPILDALETIQADILAPFTQESDLIKALRG